MAMNVDSKKTLGVERHCLVTVGATARFTQLLTEVLGSTFLDFIAANRYTHLTLQCGDDYDHFSRHVLPPLLERYPTLQITAFAFVDDLAVEMAKCRAHPGLREAGVVICHAVAPLNVDLWQVSGAMMGRYSGEPTTAFKAPAKVEGSEGSITGARREVQREEVAQMTMD
ncbi:UDP-N-acetylglucosamine transferase subunit alg13 [Colletotrichum higginsianum]|nr:UDP-N-acetylglucosamine transferase subunit alg13 [Colletotrichum higginsianum]